MKKILIILVMITYSLCAQAQIIEQIKKEYKEQSNIESTIRDNLHEIQYRAHASVYKSINKLNRTILKNEEKFYPFNLIPLPVFESVAVFNINISSLNDISLKTDRKGNLYGQISYINKHGTENLYYSFPDNKSHNLVFVGGEVVPMSFLNYYKCEYLIHINYAEDKSHSFYMANVGSIFLLIKTGRHSSDSWNTYHNSDSVLRWNLRDDDYYYQILDTIPR